MIKCTSQHYIKYISDSGASNHSISRLKKTIRYRCNDIKFFTLHVYQFVVLFI